MWVDAAVSFSPILFSKIAPCPLTSPSFQNPKITRLDAFLPSSSQDEKEKDFRRLSSLSPSPYCPSSCS